EARLLAVSSPRDGQAGLVCLGACGFLRLLAEREPDSVEQARVEAPEHVALVLAGVCAAREKQSASVAHNARVMPSSQLRRPGATCEGKQLVEPETPVPADARVRGF